MLPMWLVYILIIVLVLLDILFVIEVVVVGAFLVAYVLFNIATALIGRKINQYISERLERMKWEAELKSENRGKAAGLVKAFYSIAYLLYRIYDIGTAILISLIAFVLLVLGFAGLTIVSLALLWLLNAYIF